jgi:general stress protein 26
MVNLRNPANYPGLQAFFDKYPERLHTFFSTLSTSEKVKQINNCPQVAIYYSIPSRFYGVMLSGIMETVKDRSIKEALWHDDWEIYFPRKWQDPKYRIFRFIPEHINGWTETRKFSFKL